MAQWGNKDIEADAPKYVTDATIGKTGIEEYGDKVFALETSETVPGASSPGWVRIVHGSGTMTGYNIDNPGAGYTEDDVVTVYAGTEEIGTGTITVDDDGAIIEATILFSTDNIDAVPVITVDSVDGVGAVITPIVSGRVGRTSVETLVAMRHIGD